MTQESASRLSALWTVAGNCACASVLVCVCVFVFTCVCVSVSRHTHGALPSASSLRFCFLVRTLCSPVINLSLSFGMLAGKWLFSPPPLPCPGVHSNANVRGRIGACAFERSSLHETPLCTCVSGEGTPPAPPAPPAVGTFQHGRLLSHCFCSSSQRERRTVCVRSVSSVSTYVASLSPLVRCWWRCTLPDWRTGRSLGSASWLCFLHPTWRAWGERVTAETAHSRSARCNGLFFFSFFSPSACDLVSR